METISASRSHPFFSKGPTWRSATPKGFRNWQSSSAKHYRAQRKTVSALLGPGPQRA